MDSEDACPPETVADSAVDGGCTAPQVTVSDENAPHKSVGNVDDEAVAVFDDDLDTEFDASAFIGAMEDAALRFDSGENAPKNSRNRRGPHQGAGRPTLSSAKRVLEAGNGNAFRTCAEELDQANKTIVELKTEFENKENAPKGSADAGPLEKELAERSAECQKLKEQMNQEKEQSIDLARKVPRESLTRETIERPFKVCGITTALDGSEDGLIHCLKPGNGIPNGLYSLANARQEYDAAEVEQILHALEIEAPEEDDTGHVSDALVVEEENVDENENAAGETSDDSDF